LSFYTFQLASFAPEHAPSIARIAGLCAVSASLGTIWTQPAPVYVNTLQRILCRIKILQFMVMQLYMMNCFISLGLLH